MDDLASTNAGKLVCNQSCETSTYDELLKNMKVKNVTCDAEKVTVNFDDQFYQSPCLKGREFTDDVKTFFFKPVLSGNIFSQLRPIVGTPNLKSCPQQKIYANAAIEYGFDDCQVKKVSNSTDLIFNLEFELETSISGANVVGLVLNGGVRTSKWSVSCTYDRINEVEANNSVSVSPPVIEEFVVDVAQEFTIQMETFSNSNFSAALTYPIVKNYQDSLYFQVSFDDTNPTTAVGSRALSSKKTVGQSDNFHLIIESCWATPDINDISTNNVTLIENECVSSAVISIVEINSRDNNTNVDQWTSRVFTFPNEPAVVIKCQVRICYEKADCVRDCKKSRAGRFLGGKSVQNGKTLERTVSTGTISIRNEVENGKDELDDDESAGITTGCAFFVIVICLSFM